MQEKKLNVHEKKYKNQAALKKEREIASFKDEKKPKTTKISSRYSTLRSNDKSSDLSTINNTTHINKHTAAKHSIISKNTSASTLHFKKQISPTIEKSKNSAYTPILNEKSELIQLHSTEMSMTNTSIKGSFVNTDVFFTKLQEENRKCIDFTSKIIDSISKLKGFLTVSGKEYNHYIDKVKRNNSLSKNQFNVLYNYIDVIHEGAFELKSSFATITTNDNDNDITYDSTKINKNNIKLSSERRLNIYKKLFDICKDSFLEITEILLNLISMEEYVSAREAKLNLSSKESLSLEKVESSPDLNVYFGGSHTFRSTMRSDTNLLLLKNERSEKVEYLSNQTNSDFRKSFCEDTDLNEDEHTLLNENVNIKLLPSKITNVKKPKDTNVKQKTNLLYKYDDLLENESSIFSKNALGDIILEDSEDGDTVKEYGNNSFMVKPHKRSKSQDHLKKNNKNISRNKNKKMTQNIDKVTLKNKLQKIILNRENEFLMDFSVDEIERELDNINLFKKKVEYGLIKDKGFINGLDTGRKNVGDNKHCLVF